MPDDTSTPVSIGHARRPDQPGEIALPGGSAEPLGRAVAGMLRHLIGVLDREDRLESGTGAWVTEFRRDDEGRAVSVREGVLRALRLATDATNFAILEELAGSEGITRADLAERLGVPELSVSERVGDLVSAGLAVKVSEANLIQGTSAATAVVDWVRQAVIAGAKTLEAEL